MAIWGILAVALVTISSTETAAEETDKKVTCTATPADVGGTATVTCHFSGGVSTMLPVSLFVDFQPDGENEYGNVFQCVLVDETDHCPKTDTARYTFFPSTTSGDMALKISNVTLDDVGLYKCRQLSPRAPRNDWESCYLPVKDKPPSSTSQSSGVSEDAADHETIEQPSYVTGTTKTQVLGRNDAGDETTGMDVGLIVVYALVPTVVVVTVLTGVLCFVRRKRRSESRRQPLSREAEGADSSPPTRGEAESPMLCPQQSPHLTDRQPEREAPAAKRAEHSAESSEDESRPSSDNEREDLMENASPTSVREEIEIIAAVKQSNNQRKMSEGEFPFGPNRPSRGEAGDDE